MSITTTTQERLPKVAIVGGAEETRQILHLAKEKINVIAIKQVTPSSQVFDAKIRMIEDWQEIQLSELDVVFISLDKIWQPNDLENEICFLLAQGVSVISNQTPPNMEKIQQACLQGKSSFHIANIFPHVMLEQLASTLSRALSRVDRIDVQQSIKISLSNAKAYQHPQIQMLGLGQTAQQVEQNLQEKVYEYQNALKNVVQVLYGTASIAQLQFKTEIQPIITAQDRVIADLNFAANTVVAVRFKQTVLQQNIPILTAEEYWYLDEADANPQQMIYGKQAQNYNYNLEIYGEPSIIKTQLDFSHQMYQDSILSVLNAQAMLNVVAQMKAHVGVLMNESGPRYQMDHRIAGQAEMTPNISQSAKKKIIIWGPGEIGGAVVRAALQRDHVEIVGAKVFSPHKHGQDLGTLVGIEPLGIKASTSTEDLLKLDADCVIVTPQPRAIVEGLDQQVMHILASGKNVITSAAYHNVTMPNWLMNAQKPTQLLAEALASHGIAKNKHEERALNLLKKIQKPLSKIPFSQKALPVLDHILTPVFGRLMPPRATVAQLLAACWQGHASLHGTGVHPSFMAERIGLLLANMLPEVKHMRFIEAVDFSFMPDGMWGGLNTIGFGLPVEDLDENFIVAKAGDFYYGDVTGNVGHLLYGYDNTQIRVERSFRAIPASQDFKVGSTLIKKGHAAALHMTHKGYVGNHHFFSNEECWYLGPNHEYRGDDLPFENFQTPISYTVQVQAEQTQLNMQLSMDGSGAFAEMLQQADISSADLRCTLGQAFKEAGVTNPITNATAMAILDAVHAVCDAPAGVVIDDIQAKICPII